MGEGGIAVGVPMDLLCMQGYGERRGLQPYWYPKSRWITESCGHTIFDHVLICYLWYSASECPPGEAVGVTTDLLCMQRHGETSGRHPYGYPVLNCNVD